jgi:hypothetical protein
MSIDISGGMIIGEIGSKIESKDEGMELYEWAEDVGFESMALYYDAGSDATFYGFEVDNVPVKDIDDKWLVDVKEKASRFKELTGVEARLIGTQSVW